MDQDELSEHGDPDPEPMEVDDPPPVPIFIDPRPRHAADWGKRRQMVTGKESARVGVCIDPSLQTLMYQHGQITDQNFRREQRKMEHQRKLTNFHKFSTFTRLDIIDLAWSKALFTGKLSQMYNLCGGGFKAVYDDNAETMNMVAFQGETSFFNTIEAMLYACGACPLPDPLIKNFYMEKTFKILQQYCNFMYEAAQRKNKTVITAVELEELLQMNQLVYYEYYRHFYPVTYKIDDFIHFHNRFSLRLHEAYHRTPLRRRLYNSRAMQFQVALKAMDLTKMHFKYNNSVNTDEKQKIWPYKVDFLSPAQSLSKFAAHRFHELLGVPPLETDIILVLNWLVKKIINELVIRTWHYCQEQKREGGEAPELHFHQQAALTLNPDPLFNLDFVITDSLAPRPHLEFVPKKHERPSVECFYVETNRQTDMVKIRNHFRMIHHRPAGWYRSNRKVFNMIKQRKR